MTVAELLFDLFAVVLWSVLVALVVAVFVYPLGKLALWLWRSGK